jgi:hypothetical protein
LLSDKEQDDIVQEAQHIFTFMIEMVGELDHLCEDMDLNTDQMGVHKMKTTPIVTRDQVSVCGKERLSKSQRSQAEEKYARQPSKTRALHTGTTFWMISFSNPLSAVDFQALGQSFRNIIALTGRRHSKTKSLISNTHDSANIGVQKFHVNAFHTFLVILLLFLIVVGIR